MLALLASSVLLNSVLIATVRVVIDTSVEIEIDIVSSAGLVVAGSAGYSVKLAEL